MHWLSVHSVGLLYPNNVLLLLLCPPLWSSGQSFCLLIMRSRVWFPVLPWEIFLEGEDFYGDHGLCSLVEFRFKAPPGTSYITIHLIGTKWLSLMGIWISKFGYTSATTGRGHHKVHKEPVVALAKKKKLLLLLLLFVIYVFAFLTKVYNESIGGMILYFCLRHKISYVP
jgi:hypothetical protein